MRACVCVIACLRSLACVPASGLKLGKFFFHKTNYFSNYSLGQANTYFMGTFWSNFAFGLGVAVCLPRTAASRGRRKRQEKEVCARNTDGAESSTAVTAVECTPIAHFSAIVLQT